MRTPKELEGIQCFAWEPDNHGGGFACLEVFTTIYDEQHLNRIIKILESRRKWLAWQANGKFKKRHK